MSKVKVELLDAQIHQRKYGYNLVLSLGIMSNGLTNWARAEYGAVSGQWELSHNGMSLEKSLAVAKWAMILPDTTDGLKSLHIHMVKHVVWDNMGALNAIAKYGEINAEMKADEQNYLFDGFRSFDHSRAIIRETVEAV